MEVNKTVKIDPFWIRARNFILGLLALVFGLPLLGFALSFLWRWFMFGWHLGS
jgi:hypothetical protein